MVYCSGKRCKEKLAKGRVYREKCAEKYKYEKAGGRENFVYFVFKGVGPSEQTMLQWITPHLHVYGQHELALVGY